MAQIAIPLVIAGVLYLVSNEKKETFGTYDATTYNNSYSKDSQPNIVSISEKSSGSSASDSTYNPTSYYNSYTKDGEGDIVKNSVEHTSIPLNNEGVYSQYQDKYIIRNDKTATFQSLSGNTIDMKHNNMTSFYNNKSNGQFSQDKFNRPESTMDNYTGAGSMSIEKSEVSCFFKPHENMQNVYGNQNQSDFMQSRVVQSQRFANSKPWEEVKVAPGSSGFNSGMENREKWLDKTVDQLRAINNPKPNNPTNYVPPAYKPSDHATIGKTINKKPDTYFVNTNMKGNAKGILKPTQASEQMLTDENREHTSVSYYGTRVADTAGYVKGAYDEPHKQCLPANPYLNLTNTQMFPTTDLGKSSYKSYNNNRNSETEYVGAVKGLFMANVVNPIVNGLKHTKKSNLVETPQNVVLTGPVKPTVYNESAVPVTNRQIQVNRIGTNYMQVNRQSSDGYMTSNPYLIGQQRETTEGSYMGNAGGLSGTKSYNAEYNQRAFGKPVDNRIPVGNTNVYNNSMNVTLKECNPTNTWTPVQYKPTAATLQHFGENTTTPQTYRNVNDDYLQADMLKAFKQNPYTKPIGSVA